MASIGAFKKVSWSFIYNGSSSLYETELSSSAIIIRDASSSISKARGLLSTSPYTIGLGLFMYFLGRFSVILYLYMEY